MFITTVGPNLTASFSASAHPHAEIEVFVDGKPIKIEQGTALIQACEKAGADIPRFCYHERLSVAGNCRMCLVEVERSPKPVASCSMPAMPGMKIKTNTPLVHKAREGVMEFMLSNHPLDCPICDQGGECDLQDQSMRFGADRGRFTEFVGKRAVENKNFGPLIKTEMTRCIHCTRCVRFANEVAGINDLGTSGRGNDMQIGTYIEKMLDSEMSGNVIDLCPVGALTSKPYAFTSRPWELKKVESVDVMDALGSAIRVDARGLEVMRVLPRLNEAINEEWISDKTRFSYDGLKRQRLTTPMLRTGDTFTPVSWEQALTTISGKLSTVSGDRMTAVAGDLADAESMVCLKDLMHSLGCEDLRVGLALANPPSHGIDVRSAYTFNTGLARVEEADCVLIIGSNPRHEAAVLNARLRKSWLHNDVHIGLVGAKIDTTFAYDHIGINVRSLRDLLNEKHAFAQRLKSAKKPMVILGSSVSEHPDAGVVFKDVASLLEKYAFFQEAWNGYNVLQRDAARVAALDIGFSTSTKVANDQLQFVYLLNADETDVAQIPKSAFVVYQGHHGDVGAQHADVILPGSAYTEKTATYVNTEGVAQLTRGAVSRPGNAREDWKIIKALSELTASPLPFDDIYGLRARMNHISPTLIARTPSSNGDSPLLAKALSIIQPSRPAKGVSDEFVLPYHDYYMTNVISRASSVMAKCSRAFTAKEGAEAQRSAAH